MSGREVERTAPSSCVYETECWITPHGDQPWEPSAFRSGESDLPCCRLEPETTVKIAPMDREYGGWNEEHFHSNLRLPMECNVGKGVVVVLEALARECVAVALSPDADFVLGKTYVTHYGASGNVSTVIRRRLPAAGEAVDASFVSRVCSEESWVSYWLCLTSNGKIFAGVGKIPGEKCIGIMDDSLYHQLRSGQDAVRFVGLGNSALGKQARPLKVRNAFVTTVPETLQNKLENMSADNLSMMNIEEDQDEEAKVMMEAYNQECKKAVLRAKKFGIKYKEPNPQAFLNWSKARRLRANPQKGFATGMDISAPEELEKQRARAERFGVSSDKRTIGNVEEDAEKEEENPIEAEPIPVEQAWNNEKLTRPHRIDPPEALWVNPPDTLTEEENYALEETEIPSLVPEKIHLCSIDWAAFKQIRTDDIMTYFSIYGPMYIEWLGELSCNVMFQDKFSAARAFQNLSQQLPIPPPESVTGTEDDTPDLGSMGWTLCCQPIRKTVNDRFGRRGTTARILLRIAASTDVLMQKPVSRPAPPPGFSSKRILGPGNEDANNHGQRPKKRRRRGSRQESRDQSNTNPDGDHPLLSKGLQATRDGYSMEDMEAERASSAPAEDAEFANADTPVHDNLE
eukprot:CAMPEP_0194228754 /NCGR_PEP_ID=MMETSP0156-20130528/43535_1 /TAXON_ID=33649 /ORGANISM="Thalassionema nitzschioides, Strain L26-B" /LENGTH=627 /DNA_ID=CAMNT_0038961273 /DNA_START=698 /DNA_END=2578 /DNA_ORIENTATION=-